MEPYSYVCECCEGSFTSREGWSREKARKEAIDLFGSFPKDAMEVCDDCYVKFMKWYNEQIEPQG